MSNGTSVHMVSNYVSALKAMSVVYNLQFQIFDHPQVKYFIKSLKINRPLTVSTKNIMDVKGLSQLIESCTGFTNAITFKAIFLTAFFVFFRLSNLAPHAISQFHPSRHFTVADLFFEKNQVTLLLKWSKTIQTRDQVRLITLPRLKSLPICPWLALKTMIKSCKSVPSDPLFQAWTKQGWQPMTDSRIRKTLSKLNQKLGMTKNFYTFHAFRCSGATLAYKAHVPIQGIKDHGTWTSDCVWRYIQSDESRPSQVAQAFRDLLL